MWPSPVASKPSSTLHRSFVTSGELAPQNIARIVSPRSQNSLSQIAANSSLKSDPKLPRNSLSFYRAAQIKQDSDHPSMNPHMCVSNLTSTYVREQSYGVNEPGIK